MVNIPPISEGPRITQEEAVDTLVKMGFTTEEANCYLVEPSLPKRLEIVDKVTRCKKEAKP